MMDLSHLFTGDRTKGPSPLSPKAAPLGGRGSNQYSNWHLPRAPSRKDPWRLLQSSHLHTGSCFFNFPGQDKNSSVPSRMKRPPSPPPRKEKSHPRAQPKFIFQFLSLSPLRKIQLLLPPQTEKKHTHTHTHTHTKHNNPPISLHIKSQEIFLQCVFLPLTQGGPCDIILKAER